MAYNGAGVYIFRTRRPGLFGRVPLIGRHFAYVGMSRRVRSRRLQHIFGSMQYNTPAKPWTDLKPTWCYIPMPWAPKWILLSVETLVIALLWPVYNHQKNLWNPRRIPIYSAKRQRGSRDVVGWSFNMRWGHMVLWMIAVWFFIVKGWMPWQ